MKHWIVRVAAVVLAILGLRPLATAQDLPERTTAMVLLSSAELPEPVALQETFLRYDPSSSIQVTVDEREEVSSVLLIAHSSGASAYVMLMPVPIPNNEAEAAARGSLSFAQGWTVPDYEAHAIVTLGRPAGTDIVAHMNLFTDIVAAFVEATSAVGVYWGDAGATHSSAFFTGMAADPDRSVRLLLWSGLSIVTPSEGRISILSLGMSQLGFMELLMEVPASGLVDAISTHYDLLSYALTLGGPIPDGETVGSTMQERLPVRHVPSPIDPNRQVWSIVFP